MNKWILLSACILFLGACSESPQSTVPLYQVEPKGFAVVIPAVGELEAAQAERINTPGRSPMIIDWLAEENSWVTKGQVVARFDAEQLLLDSREEELEMMLLDMDMRKQNAQESQQQNELDSDKVLVGKEFKFVDAFAIDDLRLYSKLEIIDTLSNRDYLGAKEEFIEWKESSIDDRNQSALAVLDIRKGGHQAKFQQHQSALSQLEVIAPYDGMLVYEKNWRGDKASIGQTVFPGSTIATIPNLEKMQAKLYVLDKNAIDLEVGQTVNLTLDAYPDEKLEGEVLTVSGFSRTVKRGNPTKYFELLVSLDEQSTTLQPGAKVSGTVNVTNTQTKIVIPLQAIFNEKSENYVYIKDGRSFTRRPVKTADKNLYFVEIVEGLKAGDIIALSVPEDALRSTYE
ncbi:efflux RND transporter periplasmic adaptor subunit [Paraglaciecola arctica]|uniref:Membrane fusion efflux protein, putative n=1 Tax=Paraglaciecola arctica BSs20135 TaxID=493475 RepID=K6XIK4_9ALTE|nr:efflux RND transporter periplasmic adaptor subunit [Paraglaciecola arctica]GAC20484.1 membrane fusion efflux protein, putative [Paraglaciecola arctica BSs20135]